MKLFKGSDLGMGLAIGIGAALFGPAVLGALAGVARPLAKTAIKGGIMAYDSARTWAHEAAEMAEDLAAEARAEMAEEQEGMAAAAPVADETKSVAETMRKPQSKGRSGKSEEGA